MGKWYRYVLMASFKSFAGINPKYCYAGNLATKTPDDFGWSDECITLNTPGVEGFPEFNKKIF